jgi:hypothetical protein
MPSMQLLTTTEVNHMKEYTCIQVSHHDKIGKVIEKYQMEGWHLHTYQAQGSPTLVNHYLLFERGTQ